MDPEIPAELWMLWEDAGQCWVMDLAGDHMLVFASEEEAQDKADSERDDFEIDCRPVRVK